MELSFKNQPRISLAVVTAFFIIFSNRVNIANSIKCDKVVKIESREVLDYLGNVTFLAPGDINGQWNLTFKTNVPFEFIGGSHVWVKEKGSEGLAYFQSRESVSIRRGDKVSFRFRIRYGQAKPIPYASNIKWERWTICSNEKSLTSMWSPQSELLLDHEGSPFENEVFAEQRSGTRYSTSHSENSIRRRRRQ